MTLRRIKQPKHGEVHGLAFTRHKSRFPNKRMGCVAAALGVYTGNYKLVNKGARFWLTVS